MRLFKGVKRLFCRKKGKVQPPSTAYVISASGYRDIQSLEGTERAELLPEDIIIQPGCHLVEGESYELFGPGIYRFYRLGDFGEQRLLPPDSLEDLLMCIGHLWGHGTQDDPLGQSIRKMIQESCKRILFLSCGNVSRLAKAVLEQCGYAARIVHGVCSDSWNGWDDGHTLLEIHDGERWFAYDPSFNCCFLCDEQRLDLFSLVKKLREDTWQFDELPGNPYFGPWNVEQADCTFWMAEKFQTKNVLEQWYARTIQVPMMEANGMYKVCGEVPLVLKDNSNYIFMSEQNYLESFYGTEE